MPFPKSVIIEGEELQQVESVNIKVNTPQSPRGYHEGRTSVATVTFTRRSSTSPTQKLFEYSTNGDGRLKIISGKVELSDSMEENKTYVLDLKEAFISSWDIFQNRDSQKLEEVFVLQVGSMTLSADGKVVEYEFPEFKRNKR